MKFQFSLTIVICFFYIGVSAQNTFPPEIDWGKEYKLPGKTDLMALVPFGTSSYYGLRKRNATGISGKKQKVFVEHYNSQMNMVKSVSFALKYKNNPLEYEDFLKVGNELYLFTSYNNQAKKKNYLFAQLVSRKTLMPSDKLINIGEVDSKNIMKKGYFDVHISRDSSKVLVFNALPYQKGMPERFALHVYDNQFNELWTKDIILPYSDKDFSVEDYQVDNHGNVFLLGLNTRPEYFFTILEYSKEGSDVIEYPIRRQDKLITDLSFLIADNGNLVCSGFYADHATGRVKGTYFFQLDTDTKTIRNENLKEFETGFLTQYLTAKQIEKLSKNENLRQKAGLQHFSLDRLILRSDGGALLIAEQHFIEEYRSPGGFDPYYPYYNTYYTTDYYFHYNDIIIVNIRPDGVIEWAASIPKKQVTRNDNGIYSSFAVSIVQDKIYFLYNDSEANYVKGERIRQTNEFTAHRKWSMIALAEVSRDGSVNISPLLKNNDSRMITRPKLCKQTGKKSMIVYGEKNNALFRYGHIEFL